MATLAELFTSGYDAGEQLGMRSRARVAAQKQYGAAAGDPGLFSALQQTELDARGADRADATLQVQQDQNQRAKDAVARGADPASLGLSAENRALEKQAVTLGEKDREVQRRATLAMVNALRSQRDSGGDLGEAFDSYLDILPMMGVDPEDIPGMRETLLANPDMLDSFAASLSGDDETSAAAEKKAKAKTASGDVTMIIGEMRTLYEDLDAKQAIPTSAEKTAGEGVSRYLKSTAAGRLTGRVFGTVAESNRRSIEGMAPKLLAAMKAAEGLGAKMFDSQRDMELWMSTVTDPTQDIQTVRRLLDMFDNQYGKALQGNDVATITTKDIEAMTTTGATDGGTTTVLYPGFVNPNNGAIFKGGDYKNPDNWEMPKTDGVP